MSRHTDPSIEYHHDLGYGADHIWLHANDESHHHHGPDFTVLICADPARCGGGTVTVYRNEDDEVFGPPDHTHGGWA